MLEPNLLSTAEDEAFPKEARIKRRQAGYRKGVFPQWREITLNSSNFKRLIW